MTLKALIADDEPLARERLRMLLIADDDIEIAGECRNGREVVAALREQPIDVLFLDIQMPATDGFEVIEQIGAARMPVTVFVSAHNHYALKAFEVHALDYLTKPVEPERLHATVARVKERIASKLALETHEQMKAVLEVLKSGAPQQKPYAKRLLVHNGTKDVLIAVADIEWIEAADYYSCLHVGGKRYMLREPIKQLAITLDPAKFVRVHRSAIVNLDRIPFLMNQETVQAQFSVNPLRQLTDDNTYLIDRGRAVSNGQLVYETQTFRTKLNYQLTRAWSARVIVEYDTTLANPAETSLVRTKQVQTQGLLTWLPHPGTVVYVGWNNDLQNYNHNLCNANPFGEPQRCNPNQPILGRGPGYLNDGRQIFVKASYLFRF